MILSLILSGGQGESLEEQKWGCRMVNGSDRLQMK